MRLRLPLILRIIKLRVVWFAYNISRYNTFISINNIRLFAPRFHNLNFFFNLYPFYDKFLFYLVRDLGEYFFLITGINSVIAKILSCIEKR